MSKEIGSGLAFACVHGRVHITSTAGGFVLTQ